MRLRLRARPLRLRRLNHGLREVRKPCVHKGLGKLDFGLKRVVDLLFGGGGGGFARLGGRALLRKNACARGQDRRTRNAHFQWL